MTRKKRTLIIVGSTILLAILAFSLVFHSTKKTTLKQDFHVEDIKTVTKIFMADKFNNQMLLTKNEDSTWTIDKKYKANMPKVSMLLNTLQEIRIKYPVSISAKQNVIKTLAGSSTKIEIYENTFLIDFWKIKLFPREKLTKTIYIGKETQDNLGTFMFKKGDNRGPMVVYIPGFRGFLTPRFIANSRIWVSQEIFNTDVFAIKEVSVQMPLHPEQSFKVVKTPENSFAFVLSNGTRLSQFDTARVANFLTSFTNANFDQIVVGVPKEERDALFAKGPEFVVTVTDTTGKTIWMKSFGKMYNPYSHAENDSGSLTEIMDVDRMYAISSSIKDTVLIQYYTFDNMLQPADYFKVTNNRSLQMK